MIRWTATVVEVVGCVRYQSGGWMVLVAVWISHPGRLRPAGASVHMREHPLSLLRQAARAAREAEGRAIERQRMEAAPWN